MSNNSYLLNAPVRVSDIASLRGHWLVVAQARHCIPLPWLCMFAEADLRPCTISFNRSELVDGESRHLLSKFAILNPGTTVEAAKNKLTKARPVFEALAGDVATGAKHWRAAMAALEQLPHAWLAIDPTEILLMDELKTGAMTLASAFSSDEIATAAKRQLAGLEAGADAGQRMAGLDGGFFAPSSFEKRERSVEDARHKLAQLAKLSSCNLAETSNGYETLPLDLSTLNPPEAFWDKPALLEKGSQYILARHGDYSVKDDKKYYVTSLTNISSQPVRVRKFAGFNHLQGSYLLANFTKAWFTAKDFSDWYGVSASGWIAPGQTVADTSNWGGSDDGFWAYWCESEDKKRFMALARYPLSPAPAEEAPSTSPWEAAGDADRSALATNTDSCRKLARNFSGRELSFDRAGVQWLDDLLEQLRAETRPDATEGVAGPFGVFLKASPEETRLAVDRLVHVFASYLGECFIHSMGGDWSIWNGDICVRFDDDNAVFPINKIRKQLRKGRQEGDSVLGFYDITLAMRPKPVSDEGRRLLSLYQTRIDSYCFVLEQGSGTAQWARVKKIDGLRVNIEAAWTAGLQTMPEISVRLDQMQGFCVLDAAGTVIDSAGLSAAPPVPGPADIARLKLLRQQVASCPADTTMAQVITGLRTVFARRQQSAQAHTFEPVRVSSPSWMKPGEPLHEIVKQQWFLYTQGSIVWAALVQANSLLFSPGNADCPALLVYSRDAHFDARPQELHAIAKKIFKLKNTAPTNQEEKAVADLVTDEMDRSMGWPVPEILTARSVSAAAFMVFRKHIPKGVLSASMFPTLIHPATQAVMIVPFEFWPIDLIVLWKEGRL
ncbi:MAG: hypothetical protein V4772_10990 [Pseudomonadota bacterium]